MKTNEGFQWEQGVYHGCVSLTGKREGELWGVGAGLHGDGCVRLTASQIGSGKLWLLHSN